MTLPSLKGVGIIPSIENKTNTTIATPQTQPKIGLLDVLKEVPEATKTVFNTIGRFTKEVGQSIARSFIAVGAAVAGGERPSLANTYTPQTEIEKKIFGTDKPIGFKTIGDEVLAIGGEDFKQRWSKAAIPIGMIMAGLDIVPIGWGKKDIMEKAAQTIAKTHDIPTIVKALKPIVKGADEEIEVLAKSLKMVDKKEDVLKIIQEIGKANKVKQLLEKTKTLKPLAEQAELTESVDKLRDIIVSSGKAVEVSKNLKAAGFKDLEEFWNTIKGVKTPEVKPIPTELEPLAEEARKYKSAEEFVRNTPIDIDFLKNKIKQLTKDKLYYEKELPELLKKTGDKLTKEGEENIIKKLSQIKTELSEKKYLLEQIEKRMTPEARALKETQIKEWAMRDALKEFLTDFYNQAIKGIKEVPEKLIKPIPKELEPLAQEARKYKSVDEFIKGIKTTEHPSWIINRIQNLANQLGRRTSIKSPQEEKLLLEAIKLRGFGLGRDVEANRLEAKALENIIKREYGMSLADFYNQVTKRIPEVKPGVEYARGIMPEKPFTPEQLKEINGIKEWPKDVKEKVNQAIRNTIVENLGRNYPEKALTMIQMVDQGYSKSQIRRIVDYPDDIFENLYRNIKDDWKHFTKLAKQKGFDDVMQLVQFTRKEIGKEQNRILMKEGIIKEVKPEVSMPVETITISKEPEKIKFVKSKNQLNPLVTAYDVKIGDKVIGNVDFSLEKNNKVIYLDDIMVKPELRQMGWGTKIIDKLFRNYPQVEKIRFYVPKETPSFWEKVGAKFVGIEKMELNKQDFYKATKGIKEVKPEIPPIKPPTKPPISEISKELPEEDSVQKVINALKEAKPLRRMQETLYTEERGKRMAEALKVGEKIGGEKGFYSEKAALKGELPKVQFESIRNKLGKTPEEIQSVVDDLFNRIKKSPLLTDWEKLTAREGLAKLLGQYGGKIPTKNEMVLLDKVFGEEFTKTILDARPLLDKMKEAGYQLANIPRSMMSSFDFSASLRQAVFLAPRYPKQFASAFVEQFKYFLKEKALQELNETIAKHPNFELAKKGKLALTEMGRFLGEREERFMSNWAEKIPGIGKIIRASGRAYTGFLNKFRFDVFNSLVEGAEKIGRNPREDTALLKEIANFVNAGTGRGSLGRFEKAAVGLNTLFFSPRLMASRLTLLNPVYYIKADPFVRKEALKSLFTFLGTGMTVLGVAKLVGADVGTEPKTADFGKIKIGNTRLDSWGGFQQYIRLAAQLWSGQIVSSTTGKIMTLGEGYKPLTRLDILERFMEYKEAPIFSFITGLMRGQDYTGKPINITKEIVKRFVPMILQDMYDLAKEEPELLPLSVLGIFGVGLQTYERQVKTPKGYPQLKMGGTKLPSLKGVGIFK